MSASEPAIGQALPYRRVQDARSVVRGICLTEFSNTTASLDAGTPVSERGAMCRVEDPIADRNDRGF